MKNWIWKIHRWLGLFLGIFFLIILVSGIFLAFKPIMQPSTTEEVLGAQTAQVEKALNKIFQEEPNARSFALSADRKLIWMNIGGNMKAYDAKTGDFVREGGMSSELYGTMKKLHKELLIDADDFIEILSYVMAAMILVGLIFMTRPQFRKRLIDWHNALGVFLIPLWLMLPITAILMSLHIGGAKTKLYEDSPALPEIVQNLSEQNMLQHVVSIDSMKKATVIRLIEEGQPASVQMDEYGDLYVATISKNWPKMLHEGTWKSSLSGWLNVITASGLLFFLISGWISWTRRKIRNYKNSAQPLTSAASDIQVLVTYASQTGNAQHLAEKTAAHLNQSGVKAIARSLNAIKVADLEKFTHNLILCSSTGDGDLPDTAQHFVSELKKSSIHAKYALLGLGDRVYGNFCGGALKLDCALKNAGAHEVLPLEKLNAQELDTWKSWIANYATQAGWSIDTIDDLPSPDLKITVKLVAKTRLDNPQYSSNEVWELQLQSLDNINFEAGDLLMVTPPTDNRARSYSIGSNATEGMIRLTVGVHRYQEDGENKLGIASDWLTHQLDIGSTFNAALRHHEAFHLPNDNNPAIMIAVGTGIAAVRGFLPQLESRRRKSWLIFGNTHSLGGYFYRQDWENALSSGSLSRLDGCFEDTNGKFTDAILKENGAEIFSWLQEGGRIFACGRTRTVGKSTENALMEIAQNQSGLSPEEAQNWLAQLKVQGQLKMDLFG